MDPKELREKKLAELRLAIPTLKVEIQFTEELKAKGDWVMYCSSSAPYNEAQLAWYLEMWEQLGGEETDWSAEIDFAFNRCAAICCDSFLQEWEDGYQQGFESTALEYQYRFFQWLREMRPEAHLHLDKYWADYIAEYDDDDPNVAGYLEPDLD